MRYAIYNTTPDIVHKYGGTDIKVIRDKIIFATLDKESVQKLLAHGCVVRQVKEIKSKQNEGHNIGDIISILGFPIQDFDGSDTYVCVIDSGIRNSHEKIDGRVVYSENFTTESDGDFFNHGTGVASIITDISKCNLIDLKVLASNGIALDEDVSMAIDKAIYLYENGYSPMLINISLGDPDEGDIYNPIYVMCNEALSRGIYIIAAAGNRNSTPNAIDLPASIPGVIAVGSLCCNPESQYSLVVCDYSSRGPSIYGTVKPDVVMPGHNLVVASATGDNDYIVKSGTSFATPVVSGIMSLYLDAVNRGVSQLYTPDKLIDVYLRHSCVKPNFIVTAKDNAYGYGMIRADRFVNSMIYGNIPADIVSTSISLISLGFIASAVTAMVKYE